MNKKFSFLAFILISIANCSGMHSQWTENDARCMASELALTFFDSCSQVYNDEGEAPRKLSALVKQWNFSGEKKSKKCATFHKKPPTSL